MGDVYATSMDPLDNIQIEKELADKIGKVDILKAAHHGHCDTSNSQYLLDTMRPSIYIITRNKITYDTKAAIVYLNRIKGTATYYTGQSNTAIVISFSGSNGQYDGPNVEAETLPLNGMTPFITTQPDGTADNKPTWYYSTNNSFTKITGWNTVNNNWYYIDNNGNAKTGWYQNTSGRYYFKPNGVMAVGKEKIDGKYYYFSNDGVMVTGWLKNNSGGWYYFDSDGKMATGSRTINGKTYHFGSDGSCLNP